MKKVVLLLLAAAIAATPAVAATKKKAKKDIDPNEASLRLVKNGLPLILPFWAMPIYFNAQEADKKDHKKKH
jgi:hypothetical protein